MIQKIQRINELFDIGGDKGGHENRAEQQQKNRHNPTDGKENDLLAGSGELGGSDAMLNDASRFMDWINGNGAYGVFGRDFSYDIASMAIVNPAAAGIVLGAMASASAIYGMCTSSWARFNRAQRRLKKIYNGALSDKGYKGSIGFSLNFKSSKLGDIDGYDNGVGPVVFKKRIMADVKEAITNIGKSGLVSDGSTGRSEGTSKKIGNYTDSGNKNQIGAILNTVTSTLYIPSSYVDKESGMYQKFLTAAEKSAGSSRGISVEDWKKISQEKQGLNSFTPIEKRANDQILELTHAGENVCKEYEKLMQYSLKKGSMSVRNKVDKLNSFWKRCVEAIDKRYKQIVDEMKTSDEMKNLSAMVDSVSKIDDSLTMYSSYRSAFNPGDLLAGQLASHLKVNRTYEVISVDGYGTDSAYVRLCNSNIARGGVGLVYKVSIDELFDRAQFVKKFVPMTGTGKAKLVNGSTGPSYYMIDVPSNSIYAGGRIGGGGNPSFGEHMLVQAHAETIDVTSSTAVYFGMGAPTTGGSTTREVAIFSVVNFTPSTLRPGAFWLPLDVFNQYIVTGGYVEEQLAKYDGPKKENQSATIEYNGAFRLNEATGNQQNGAQQANASNGSSNGTESAEKETKLPKPGTTLNKLKRTPKEYKEDEYSDNTLDQTVSGTEIKNADDSQMDNDMKESAFVFAAYYLLRNGKNSGRIVETGMMVPGKVRYYLPVKSKKKSEEEVDMNTWISWDPVQVGLIDGSKSEDGPKPDPTPDDDNDGEEPESLYLNILETGYPISYRTIEKVYMKMLVMYEPYVKRMADELMAYAIVLDDKGMIKGLADVSEEESVSLYSLSNPDMFDKYIAFLGKEIAFKDDAELLEFLSKEYSESYKYDIVDGVLNESADEIDEVKDEDGIDAKLKKRDLTSKANKGMISTFASYYQQKISKMEFYGNNATWSKKYKEDPEKYRKALRKLDIEYFVQYMTTLCAGISNPKIKEAFKRLGKEAEYTKMIENIQTLTKDVYKEKSIAIDKRKLIQYTNDENMDKYSDALLLFCRHDGIEIPVFNDAVTRLKECLTPYIEFMKSVPEAKKKQVTVEVKNNVKIADEKVTELRKDAVETDIKDATGQTNVNVDQSTNVEANVDGNTDVHVSVENNIEIDFSALKKEIIDAIEESTPDEKDMDLIDVPTVVKKICAELKHDLDEKAKDVIASYNQSVKMHMAKGGYTVQKEEWENARSKDYAKEVSAQNSENPSEKYFNRYGNGWVVVELLEDHIDKQENKENQNSENQNNGNEFHFKFEDKEIVFTGNDWMEDITRVESAVAYASEDGDAIWTYMQQNTGLVNGRTYTTPKSTFDEFLGESFANRFFRDMMLFEEEGEVSDDVIFLVKDVKPEEKGVFVLTTSDNQDHDVPYNKIVEKTMNDGKFIGTDIFTLYRVDLVEGATYKMEDSEYFDNFFGELAGESDDQKYKFMNEIHIKNNDAFMSTVKFTVGGKEFDKHYFEIDVNKFAQVEKKEEVKEWWEEGHSYDIDGQYFSEKMQSIGEKIEDTSKPVEIAIGKTENDEVSVTFKSSGKEYKVAKQMLLDIPEDKRSDVSVRSFFGENGVTTNDQASVMSKEEISKFGELKNALASDKDKFVKFLMTNQSICAELSKAFVGVKTNPSEEGVNALIDVINAFCEKIVVTDGSNDIEEGGTYDIYYMDGKTNGSNMQTCRCEHKSKSDEDPYIISIGDNKFSIDRQKINNIVFVRNIGANEGVNYGGIVSFIPSVLKKCELYNLPLNEAIVLDLGQDKTVRSKKLNDVLRLILNMYEKVSSGEIPQQQETPQQQDQTQQNDQQNTNNPQQTQQNQQQVQQGQSQQQSQQQPAQHPQQVDDKQNNQQ